MQNYDIYKMKKSDEIYLYGINQVSVNAYYNMIKQGYNVRGIIDQRANFSEPMYISKEQFFYDSKDNERINIIICLNDGMNHDAVAEDFFKNGIIKILFLPMKENFTFEMASYYRKSYIKFLDGEYENINIPLYRKFKKKLFEVVAENKKSVIFLCPFDYIRVDKRVFTRKQNDLSFELKEEIKKYINCYIGEFDLYLNLWRYISGENVNCDKYFLFHRKNENERKKLLENRRELYTLFDNNFKKNFQFFYDSPASVLWNDEGFCTVIDGLHRICFLYLKGINYFPVKIIKDDFYKMLNYFESKE